jgi:hypothetical protein
MTVPMGLMRAKLRRALSFFAWAGLFSIHPPIGSQASEKA